MCITCLLITKLRENLSSSLGALVLFSASITHNHQLWLWYRLCRHHRADCCPSTIPPSAGRRAWWPLVTSSFSFSLLVTSSSVINKLVTARDGGHGSTNWTKRCGHHVSIDRFINYRHHPNANLIKIKRTKIKMRTMPIFINSQISRLVMETSSIYRYGRRKIRPVIRFFFISILPIIYYGPRLSCQDFSMCWLNKGNWLSQSSYTFRPICVVNWDGWAWWLAQLVVFHGGSDRSFKRIQSVQVWHDKPYIIFTLSTRNWRMSHQSKNLNLMNGIYKHHTPVIYIFS